MSSDSNYFLIFILLLNALQLIHSETIQKVESCLKDCKHNDADLERLRNGQHICSEVQNLPPKLVDPCALQCLGVPFKMDGNQTNCLCEFCKNEHRSHKLFCPSPGKNQIIKPGECEEMVCTGKAKYYGVYCMDEEKQNSVVECKKSCEQQEGILQRMKDGLFTCEDHGHTISVNDPCLNKCDVQRKCCACPEDTEIAEDQTGCFCKYCKQNDKLAHLEFCVEQGNQTFIKEGQCEELVCTGKAKYYGKLCTFPSK